MALTTVTYSSYFNNALATKQITFTDSTDFVAAGTVAANVTVVAKVESPLGIFYNNTNHSLPDIDCGVSLDSIIEIPLPLSGGEIVQGLYTITLTYVDSVVPATIVDVKTFTVDYTSPSVDVSIIADCISPLLSATDKTAYIVNSVTPTVVRDFTLNYPAALSIDPIEGTSSILETVVLYTSSTEAYNYSATLTSDLTYLFDIDNLIYFIDEVSGSKITPVTCSADLCDIYCCMRSQYNRWQSFVNVNSAKATDEFLKYIQIMAIAEQIDIALRCSKGTHVSELVDKILLIANCDAGCGCADGVPQLVTGLGVAGNTVILTQGTGMNITSSTGGGVTTYVVNLSSINVNKLAATYNAVPAAGTNVTVDAPVSVTTGDVTTITYTINSTDTIVETLLVRSLFTMNSAAVPTITVTNQKEYGTTFATVNQTGGTEFVLNNKDTNFTEWATNFTDFTIGNFFSAGSVSYWPEVSVVNVVLAKSGGATTWQGNVKAKIITIGASSFGIRFEDELGNPINGKKIQDFTTLELIFKIQA